MEWSQIIIIALSVLSTTVMSLVAYIFLSSKTQFERSVENLSNIVQGLHAKHDTMGDRFGQSIEKTNDKIDQVSSGFDTKIEKTNEKVERLERRMYEYQLAGKSAFLMRDELGNILTAIKDGGPK